jgi:hypothetical protein
VVLDRLVIVMHVPLYLHPSRIFVQIKGMAVGDENTALRCSAGAVAKLQGLMNGRAIPLVWQQLVAHELLQNVHGIFKKGDAEMLLDEQFMEYAREYATCIGVFEWHSLDDSFRLFQAVPSFIAPIFVIMIAKVGKFLVCALLLSRDRVSQCGWIKPCTSAVYCSCCPLTYSYLHVLHLIASAHHDTSFITNSL